MDHQRIFDFHARLSPGDTGGRALLASMDAHGIDRAAVCAGGVAPPDVIAEQVLHGGGVRTDPDNAAVLVACSASGGRLLPFYFANPHRDAGEYARHADAFVGLEVSPAVHGVDLTDRRTLALVEIAAAHAQPVYVVCLGRAGSTVDDLVRVAAACPSVTFVLGHCGFVGIDFYAVRTVAPLANVVAETSGCYTSVARAALARLGAGRLLFGTEYPVQHPAVELAKMRQLGLDAGDWRAISWDNAHRLLGTLASAG